jgi:hypothetical protein
VLDQPTIQLTQLLADVLDQAPERDRVRVTQRRRVEPARICQDGLKLDPPGGLPRLSVIRHPVVVSRKPEVAGVERMRRQPALVKGIDKLANRSDDVRLYT